MYIHMSGGGCWRAQDAQPGLKSTAAAGTAARGGQGTPGSSAESGRPPRATICRCFTQGPASYLQHLMRHVSAFCRQLHWCMSLRRCTLEPGSAQADLVGPDSRTRPLRHWTAGAQLAGADLLQSAGREPPPILHQVRSSAGCYLTVRLGCGLRSDVV